MRTRFLPRCEHCGLRIVIDPYGPGWVHLSVKANADHWPRTALPLTARASKVTRTTPVARPVTAQDARLRDASELPQPTHNKRVRALEFSFTSDWHLFEASGKQGGAHDPRSDARTAIGQRNPHVPTTDLQALMETPPHEEPAESSLRFLAIRDLLAGCVDRLPDECRFAFESHFYKGLSFRQLGREMGTSKSTAERLYRTAIRHLREALTEWIDP